MSDDTRLTGHLRSPLVAFLVPGEAPVSRWTADSWAYRRQRRAFLLANPICWLCAHPGADQIDHALPVGPPHFGPRFDQANWRPAHGGRGCPTCAIRCNQVRGNRIDRPISVRSRRW